MPSPTPTREHRSFYPSPRPHLASLTLPRPKPKPIRVSGSQIMRSTHHQATYRGHHSLISDGKHARLPVPLRRHCSCVLGGWYRGRSCAFRVRCDPRACVPVAVRGLLLNLQYGMVCNSGGEVIARRGAAWMCEAWPGFWKGFVRRRRWFVAVVGSVMRKC